MRQPTAQDRIAGVEGYAGCDVKDGSSGSDCDAEKTATLKGGVSSPCVGSDRARGGSGGGGDDSSDLPSVAVKVRAARVMKAWYRWR